MNTTTPGSIGVKMSQPDGHLIIEVSDDGVGMDGNAGDGSFGMRLIRQLGRQLRADVEWRNASPGTRVLIKMPNEEQKRDMS